MFAILTLPSQNIDMCQSAMPHTDKTAQQMKQAAVNNNSSNNSDLRQMGATLEDGSSRQQAYQHAAASIDFARLLGLLR